jgi:hypothetical protein
MVVGLLLTVRIVGLITRMPRIDRPPIKANIGAETAWLDKPLGTIVATLAQALKRAEPEFVDIAVMWLDVIADFRRLDDAALCAILAQRMFTQLVPPDPRPASRGVPLIPFCQLAANAPWFNLSFASHLPSTAPCGT